MNNYWEFKTEFGLVRIVPKEGSYHVEFHGEFLGSYESPKLAAIYVADGHSSPTSKGLNLGTLGISDNIDDWNERHMIKLDSESDVNSETGTE